MTDEVEPTEVWVLHCMNCGALDSSHRCSTPEDTPIPADWTCVACGGRSAEWVGLSTEHADAATIAALELDLDDEA